MERVCNTYLDGKLNANLFSRIQYCFRMDARNNSTSSEYVKFCSRDNISRALHQSPGSVQEGAGELCFPGRKRSMFWNCSDFCGQCCSSFMGRSRNRIKTHAVDNLILMYLRLCTCIVLIVYS